MKSKAIWLLPLGLWLYSIFTYTLVDGNLVLSSINAYWQVQQLLWLWATQQRQQMALLYALVIVVCFVGYYMLIKQLQSHQVTTATLKKFVLLSIAPLLISYPALSHDVFNYMFNAKMVWVYKTNPHQKVALDFPQDQWLQFMHNVHTPAPYGYGWTGISLVPSVIGQNNLKSTLMLFRILMLGSLIALALLQLRMVKEKMKVWVVAFILNPLVLIETVSNIHNDVVMMLLLFLSIYLFKVGKNNNKKVMIALALVMFLVSISIKYASVLLVAGLILEWLVKKISRRISFGGSQMMVMFLPLFTKRSQRFLPWYLIWNLSFLGFTKERILRNTALWFSVTGLLSYVPFLYFGGYSPDILWYRSLILFSLPTFYLLTVMIKKLNYLK